MLTILRPHRVAVLVLFFLLITTTFKLQALFHVSTRNGRTQVIVILLHPIPAHLNVRRPIRQHVFLRHQVWKVSPRRLKVVGLVGQGYGRRHQPILEIHMDMRLRLAKHSTPIEVLVINVHYRLVPITVHGVGAKVLVQHLPVGVQNQTKLSAKRGEFNLLDRVVRMIAVRGAPFHHPMGKVVHMEGFKVMEIFVQLCWRRKINGRYFFYLAPTCLGGKSAFTVN
jgi:hypothetical protein